MGILEDSLSAGANLWFVIAAIVIFLIIGAAFLYWIFYVRPYKIKGNVYSHYNNQIVKEKKTYHVGRFLIDGVSWYKIREDPQARLNSELYADVLYGDSIDLFKLAPGQYAPYRSRIELEEKDGTRSIAPARVAQVIPSQILVAHAQTQEDNRRTFEFKSRLEELMPIIGLIVIGLITIAMFWVAGGSTVNAATKSLEAAQAQERAAEDFRASIEILVFNRTSFPIGPRPLT